MAENKSAKKTLLMSVIMSSPGPLVVGLGLLVGKSSTQIADFVRRSIELLAIILSFAVYCLTTKGDSVDELKKKSYERGTNIFVSCAMVLSGVIMSVLALTSQAGEKGNVIPGLAIALLGVLANSIFWVKYTRLGRETNNKILIVQSNLYRAKTFVDLSVVVALGVVLLSSNPDVAYYFDLVGTLCVSAYLAFTGVKSFIDEMK
ncbi:MAG: cation transporter [Clostridia bacterium]|nr:cation transporter [Clostridia bacterium]